MQDPSDAMEAAEPEDNGRTNNANSPAADDPASQSGGDSAVASTVLVEVRPGVAVAFGEVPADLRAELKLDPVDVGLLSVNDRTRISAALASIGNTATVGGNLANAFAGVEGVYRLSDASRAYLSAGGALAVKDGANLRWCIEDGETLRALGLDAPARIGAILDGAKEKVAPAMDKTAARNLVAVTDRRIITAKANALLGQGEIGQDIPTDQVRYVRAPAARDGNGRSVIDLITSEDNIRWLFDSDIDSTHVAELAAVLAESMNIPDDERAQLQRPCRASLEADTKGESAGTKAGDPSGSEATTGDAE